MTERVRQAVELILEDAAEGGSSFAWPFDLLRHAAGDPPQDWTVVPPQGREHPDYVFAALGILMEVGLLAPGDWREGEFVVSVEPLDVQLAQMRDYFDDIPSDRPVLAGDVANFVATSLGRQSFEDHSPLLDQAVDAIDREWAIIDRRYGRERPNTPAV
jgi:hypothetical protein